LRRYEDAEGNYLFITFEGLDGSGKTTQMTRLAARLRSLGRVVVETREPGGTRIGSQIRRILLDAAHHELHPTAELLLYFASRAQNVEEVIRPALDAGNIVLCDRFTDSTVAYQSRGRKLGDEPVRVLERIACGGLQPDLTLWIDIPPEESLARARGRNTASGTQDTRMDEQSVEFYRKVNEGYRALAERYPERIRRIEGSGGVDIVEREIWSVTQEKIEPAGNKGNRG
jgi:dTMP kinase